MDYTNPQIALRDPENYSDPSDPEYVEGYNSGEPQIKDPQYTASNGNGKKIALPTQPQLRIPTSHSLKVVADKFWYVPWIVAGIYVYQKFMKSGD